MDDFFVLFSSLLQEVRIHVLWRDQISAEVGRVWGVVGGEARVEHFLALDTEPGQNESQEANFEHVCSQAQHLARSF